MSKLIEKTCPGCSGEAESYFTVETEGRGIYTNALFFHCNGCGGVFTDRPVLRKAALRVVKLDAPMVDQHVDPENTRYFDIEYIGDLGAVARTHGWYHIETHEVVQYG